MARKPTTEAELARAKKLRRERIFANLKQQDVAAAVNITPQRLCHYEKGREVCSEVTYRAVMKAIRSMRTKSGREKYRAVIYYD